MTSITEVIDLFMMLQNDYRLLTIYQTSGSSALNTYLESWLLFSIQDFSPMCNQSLEYDTATQMFSETLTVENMTILAQIMTKYWLIKEVQNILNMSNLIQDHDYKTFSQAQNLREKRDFLNNKKEEISQLLNDYSYKYNNWSDWSSQNFGV